MALITVPHTRLQQGAIGDDNFEAPIDILYCRNCISLEQDDRVVILNYENINKLFNLIKKHEKEALKILKP